MQEREVKLAVPVGFELPELGGPDDGFQAEPQAPRRMRVTYYDTPDLRLARWGASLRHRTGEGWTVKLPAGQEGAMLVRGEHVFPGDGRRPPAEAVDLVRAFVRGSQLAPVARLRTLRRPVELRDQQGERLAELVDDEVQVLDGRRIASRFREVEVELAEAAGTGVLDRVLERLRQAGAETAEPIPKYLRALAGRERQLGPELAQPKLDRDASVAALLRHDLAAGTTRLFRHEAAVRVGEDPEAVHQARVATRRLRSTLRTFRSLLEPEWTTRLRDELKWLAEMLGGVRDAEVLDRRISDALAAEPPELVLGPVAARLSERLRGDTAKHRAALVRVLDGRRYAALLDDLDALLAEPPTGRGAEPADDVVRKRVRKAVTEVDELIKAAMRAEDAPDRPEAPPLPGVVPPDEALHEARKAAKRAR
ncbi:MAG TPA: CYTH and CHAD domain-containing protein, partial [Actinomycetota bacterium]